MSYLTRRQKIACAVVGMAAGVFVGIWDGVQTNHSVGWRMVLVTFESPDPVKSVLFGFRSDGQKDDAVKCRDWIAMGGLQYLPSLGPIWFEPAMNQSFVMNVRTSSTESGLKLTRNTFNQTDHYSVVVIELENGEEWVTVLDLPDVRQSTQATIRLPGDARQVRPTPKVNNGGW